MRYIEIIMKKVEKFDFFERACAPFYIHNAFVY